MLLRLLVALLKLRVLLVASQCAYILKDGPIPDSSWPQEPHLHITNTGFRRRKTVLGIASATCSGFLPILLVKNPPRAAERVLHVPLLGRKAAESADSVFSKMAAVTLKDGPGRLPTYLSDSG